MSTRWTAGARKRRRRGPGARHRQSSGPSLSRSDRRRSRAWSRPSVPGCRVIGVAAPGFNSATTCSSSRMPRASSRSGWSPSSSRGTPKPEAMAAVRSALIIANDEYQDPKLRRLRAPAQDAEALGRVLSDPQIGDFEVEVSRNEPEHVIRRKIAAFFDNRRREDLLLLHISSHGLKDDSGRLYFAATDTEVDHLDATAVWAEFVNRQMTNSRSRRIVLLLDCCYSGAFARGMGPRAGESVEVRERFEGSGRAVLTASSAMEYSFEGEELSGEGNPSVFTSAVVKALQTGEADRDGDNWISVDELYDYVHDQVQEITPKQTPGKWVFDLRGDLYIAKSRYPGGDPEGLPAELVDATESPLAYVREGAVHELGRLLRGGRADVAEAARVLVRRLAEDDSRRVCEAAKSALASAAPPAREPERRAAV